MWHIVGLEVSRADTDARSSTPRPGILQFQSARAETSKGIIARISYKSRPDPQAFWNGKKLTPVAFVAKPLDHPYAVALGQPDQYADALGMTLGIVLTEKG